MKKRILAAILVLAIIATNITVIFAGGSGTPPIIDPGPRSSPPIELPFIDIDE